MKSDELTVTQMIHRLMTVAKLLAKGSHEPKPKPDRPAKNTKRRS